MYTLPVLILIKAVYINFANFKFRGQRLEIFARRFDI